MYILYIGTHRRAVNRVDIYVISIHIYNRVIKPRHVLSEKTNKTWPSFTLDKHAPANKEIKENRITILCPIRHWLSHACLYTVTLYVLLKSNCESGASDRVFFFFTLAWFFTNYYSISKV